MASASKVIVRLVDPILTNRAEDVDRESILEHLDLVLHPAGNLKDVAFTHDDFASINRELQHTFQDLCDLLALVRMTRHDAAALQLEVSDGDAVAREVLPFDPGGHGLCCVLS